jgi:hypothetical protein
MNPKKLVPILLIFTLCAAARVARAQEPVKAELDAPFALAVGETARLESENFEVTLRSMSDDSGCDDPKDCSSILFKGTLLTRHGEKKEMGQIMAFFTPDKPYTMTYEGYQVQMTTIRRPDPKGPLYATFRVVKAPPEEKKEE